MAIEELDADDVLHTLFALELQVDDCEDDDYAFHEYGHVSKVIFGMTNTRCLCKRIVQQNQSL